jgi:FixJ family two-component response regulator
MPRQKDSPADALRPRERAFLEYRAEGLSDREIAARLQISHREISAIRGHTASTLASRVASAHPFQISEVVLARLPDSVGVWRD